MEYIVRLDRQTRARNIELARSRHELQPLSTRLLDAQETERRAISRELHDEVGQSLGALLVDIGRLSTTLSGGHPEVKAQLDSLKSVAERSFQSVRNIALLLRVCCQYQFRFRFNTASCWRRARTSRAVSLRERTNTRSAAAMETKKAITIHE